MTAQQGSNSILAVDYDVALLDLDGTIYEGQRAVPYAKESLQQSMLACKFVTNNASRTPQVVAEQLQGLGYNCAAADVFTSAQAAIELATQQVPPPAKAYVLGAPSFKELITSAGYQVVPNADHQPDVVFHGLNREMTWKDMSEAALAIARGAIYVLSNRDTTLPDERGFLVGNGSVAAAITSTTGVEPISAGKPAAPMFHLAASGFSKPLAIGDRLDTDILGGNNAGYDTLLTITGVSRYWDVLNAPANQRPTLIAEDMRALLRPRALAEPRPQGNFTAQWLGDDSASGVVKLEGEGTAIEALLTVASVAWTQENPVEVEPSPSAEAAVQAWI